jgi:membrane fusion protein, multidrug efflux system
MEDDPKTYTYKKPGWLFFVGSIVAVGVAVILTAGMVRAQHLRLSHQTEELGEELGAGPRVLVRPVIWAPRSRTLELPGTIHGFVETQIHAKIAGYLKAIYVDKGDRVKQGQLLALLDSPELDHQMANARATYNFAEVTDKRNQSLLRLAVLAPQQADQSHAQMLEAKESLDQLVSMQTYKEIRAPFDGIVTARYVDPGALIVQSTSPSTSTSPLLGLAVVSPVRVYASVPQSAAAFIRDGMPAAVSVTEYPERTFEGTITRHPGALDSDTRTMLVEVDLPNLEGTLLPGMYAQLSLEVATPAGLPMVPDDAVVFEDGKSFVPIVLNNHLKLAEVKLGYDDGVNVQVIRGVADNDMVAVNTGQTARDGEAVRPVIAAATHP